MRHFGLIGKSLNHSFSKDYFAKKFQKERILDATYSARELANLDELEEWLKQKKITGFNVTIPYKEEIIQYLDKIDPIAEQIGAVNTVCILRGEKWGYNTDVLGFQKSIRPFLAIEHNRALILGTGGASKAVAYFLDQLSIPYFYCSRHPSDSPTIIQYENLDDKSIQQFPLIINTTPLGTFPNLEEMPAIPIDGIGPNHLVYDLIYNPVETRLLKTAKAQGALVCNGLNMLKIQAEESWKIWEGLKQFE